jgi:hypothetical protein
MAVLKDVTTPRTGMIVSRVAGGMIGFGVALKRSAAGVVQAATADNSDPGVIVGFSAQPANGVVLGKDGFYQSVNNAAVPDVVRMIKDGYANLLVCSKGALDIIEGDLLEIAILGGAGSGVGVLEEAGAGGNVGETNVTTALAKAEEDCAIASLYQHPASGVAIGDSTITFTSGNLTSLDVTEGDYIILVDSDGLAQLNRVKSKTATVVTLELAATVAVITGDYVYKAMQCYCKLMI